MSKDGSPKLEKVVIQCGGHSIKGFMELPRWETIQEMLDSLPQSPPQSFRVRRLESDSAEDIPVSGVKAVFYVNSFEGDSDHKELIFYSRAPIAHGIWMRVQFRDGEVMEGIVHNSIRYLVDPGFFMIPTDPGSNNKLVYVMKSWLVDHRILGTRKLQ